MGGIVWLASYLKSGNTWLRAFLHNLMLDPPAPVSINELSRFTIGDTQKNWIELALGRRVERLPHEGWAALRPSIHEGFTRASPDSVFVKTHMFLGEAHGSPTISMDHTTGAIYLVRDPRDLAISAAAHFGTDIDGVIRVMADPGGGTPEDDTNAPQYYGTWSSHVSSWTQERHPALLVMRYEDMVADPTTAFSGVARFLGLPASPERLAKAIRFSSFEELQGQETRDGFAERPARVPSFFRAGKVGQWREVLTDAQRRAVESQHGEVMRRFGYLDFAAPIP